MDKGEQGTSTATVDATAKDRPVRLLVLCPHMPPRASGIADYAARLFQELAQIGVEITVLYDGAECQPVDGVRCVKLPAVSGSRFTRAVLDAVREFRPDILNLHYQEAMYGHKGTIHLLPGRLRRAGFHNPIVATCHDFNVPYLFPKASLIRPVFVRILARSVDHIIVTNEGDQKGAMSRYGVPAERFTRIPVGYNMDPPDASEMEAARKAAPGFRVGFFGLVMRDKGLEESIEALALAAPSVPGLELRLIGSDKLFPAYRKDLEALAAQRGVGNRVHFTGELGTEDLRAELAALDACVLLFPGEGVSTRRTSFLMVMAFGLPTITTRGANLPEGLEDGKNCLLLPVPATAEAAASAIARLAENPDLAKNIGAGARAWAADYSYPRIAERHATLFRKLARKV